MIYRRHAIERMFQREISENDVEKALVSGSVIESYKDDKPYPSYLLLNIDNFKALHVVYAITEEDEYIIITVYFPDTLKWENDFKIRKQI